MTRENDEQLSLEELAQLAEKIEEVVEDYTEKMEKSSNANERKQWRKERKTPKQLLTQVKEWIVRKHKYQKDFDIFGTRNSYSKTDQDATFMRTKEDYMKNGQLKPGYNLQVASEGQYTLAYGIFSNSTDTKTLTPFLDQIQEQYFSLPEYIVADAGYGSEQNYEDILTKRQCTPIITYGHCMKEQKKKYKTDPVKTSNWLYDQIIDTYTCPNQQAVTYKYTSTRTIPQDLNAPSKFMNVRTVRIVHFGCHVQREKKAQTVN